MAAPNHQRFMKSLQPEVLEGCGLVFLAGTGPVNSILGYQGPGGALLGRQIQLVDSGRQRSGLQMVICQRQSLTAIWGWHQSIALLGGFQKTYTCLGLSSLREKPSPFWGVLSGLSLKGLSPGSGVPETPFLP